MMYPPSFSSSTDEIIELTVEMIRKLPERSFMQLVLFPIALWIVLFLFLFAHVRETLQDAFR